MISSLFVLWGLLLPFTVYGRYVPRDVQARASSSSVFTGSSLYFLHGLSEADQDDYINTLAGDGAKVLRLWVTNVPTGCSKGSNVVTNTGPFESDIRTYNYDLLAALDKVLSKMVAKGMKAIISPHDGNALKPGDYRCDAYCNKYGSADSYYQSDDAKAEIDARYAAILNYTSPSSGKAWGQWSEAILAVDIENEPFQDAQDLASNNDPSDWLCGRAGKMKPIINNSGVLIATGGVGGDQSHGNNLMDKAVQCDAIDIISIHGYVSTASFWTSQLPTWLSTVKSNNKLLMVEEFGYCDDASQQCGSVYQDDFDKQATAIAEQGVPWTYWQLVPGPDDSQAKSDCWTGCCSGYDGFEVGLHNETSKGDPKATIAEANGQKAAQEWPL